MWAGPPVFPGASPKTNRFDVSADGAALPGEARSSRWCYLRVLTGGAGGRGLP